MLTDLENSIIQGLQELGKLLPDADMPSKDIDAGLKMDIAIEGAKLMRKLQVRFEENEPAGEEFFLEFAKNTPVLMREMFIFGGITSLSLMLK